jgi:uncharacterized membrane protein
MATTRSTENKVMGRLDKKDLVAGAVAGATVFAAVKFDLKSVVPSIGVSSPIIIALAGFVILGFSKDGSEIIDGVGYGLVAYGVVNFA